MNPTMMLPLVAAKAAGHSRAALVFDCSSVTALFYPVNERPVPRRTDWHNPILQPLAGQRCLALRGCPKGTAEMSLYVVAGFLAGLAAAIAVYRYIDHAADIYSVALVVGIAALAVVVTVIRVDQYHAQQHATAAAEEELSANSGSSNPPLRLAPGVAAPAARSGE
jgi:hypothetical protein